MDQIDSERGDVSRSRFLLRMIEIAQYLSNWEIMKNDPLDEGCETPVSSESAGA